jgi:hypothetical protein
MLIKGKGPFQLEELPKGIDHALMSRL